MRHKFYIELKSEDGHGPRFYGSAVTKDFSDVSGGFLLLVKCRHVMQEVARKFHQRLGRDFERGTWLVNCERGSCAGDERPDPIESIPVEDLLADSRFPGSPNKK